MSEAGALALAQSLAAGTSLLASQGALQAEPGDLAALLEVYVRVASQGAAQRRSAGLDALFVAATDA